MAGSSRNMHIEDLGEKQRLSLPACVCAVMDNDMLDFMGEDNPTGYLNRVIAGMLTRSRANVTAGADARMQTYKEVMTQMPLLRGKLSDRNQTELARELAQALAAEDRTELMRRYREDTPEGSVNVRLNNENCDRLQMPEVSCNWNPKGSRWRDERLFKNRREFLEVLLYDYSLRTPAEREAIYFADTIRILESVLAEELSCRSSVVLTNRVMKGTQRGGEQGASKGRRSRASASRAEQNSYLVVPYRLATGNDGRYYYLVGMSRELNNPNAPWVPQSYRLSRIDSIRVTGRHGISRVQQRELDARIRKGGVDYVSNAPGKTPIRVLLNEEGIRNYGRILHNRPRRKSTEVVEGGEILTFDCTRFEAMNYFKRFGASARILEPESMVKAMRDFYRDALETYVEDCDVCGYEADHGVWDDDN